MPTYKLNIRKNVPITSYHPYSWPQPLREVPNEGLRVKELGKFHKTIMLNTHTHKIIMLFTAHCISAQSKICTVIYKYVSHSALVYFRNHS